MGLLSSLKEKAVSAVKTVGMAITKPAVIVATAITSPKAFIENPKEAVSNFVKQPITTQVVKGAVAGAALGAVATGAAAKAVVAVAKVATSTTKAKLVTAAVAPVVATAVLKKPEVIAEAPSKILNLQTNVGELIAEPSIQKVKEVYSENPVLATAATAAVVGAVGYTAAKAVGSVGQVIATKEQTEAIKESTKTLQSGAGTVLQTGDSQLPKESMGTPPKAPLSVPASDISITPPSKTVEATPVVGTTSIKRKGSPTRARVQPISQRVSILINNRSVGSLTNKRYINGRVYALA